MRADRLGEDVNSGARAAKAIAESLGAGGAGGEFGDQIRLNTPGVTIGPSRNEYLGARDPRD